MQQLKAVVEAMHRRHDSESTAADELGRVAENLRGFAESSGGHVGISPEVSASIQTHFNR